MNNSSWKKYRKEMFEIFFGWGKSSQLTMFETLFCIISLLRRELTATHVVTHRDQNVPENHYRAITPRRKSTTEKHKNTFRDGGDSPRSIRFDLKPWSSSVPGRLTPGRRMPQRVEGVKNAMHIGQVVDILHDQFQKSTGNALLANTTQCAGPSKTVAYSWKS